MAHDVVAGAGKFVGIVLAVDLARSAGEEMDRTTVTEMVSLSSSPFPTATHEAPVG